MIEGIDCATPLSAANVARLRLAGKKFVCRYLAPPGSIYDWKRLRRSEVMALRAARMGLVCVYETSSTRARGGAVAGREDALAANALLAQLGIPGAPVYFAVDFDATPGDQAAIKAYLVAAGSVLGHARVGIYGGFWPVNRALNAGVVKYAWQTYAWSGGRRDPRAQLYQYRNGVSVGGVGSADLDRASATDYGQIPRPKPPKPKPLRGQIRLTYWDGSKHWIPLTDAEVNYRIRQWKKGDFKELLLIRRG